MTNDEILREALDKLDASKGFDAPMTAILSTAEIDEMRSRLQPMLDAPRMTPRVPPEADVAAEVVGRYERGE